MGQCVERASNSKRRDYNGAIYEHVEAYRNALRKENNEYVRKVRNAFNKFVDIKNVKGGKRSNRWRAIVAELQSTRPNDPSACELEKAERYEEIGVSRKKAYEFDVQRKKKEVQACEAWEKTFGNVLNKDIQ